MFKPPMKSLFLPLKVGPLTLSHRVVMAPLTRLRSDQPGDIPNDLMVEYYRQRASRGGLIITEATTISITGRGYLGAPGIYSDAQVAGMAEGHRRGPREGRLDFPPVLARRACRPRGHERRCAAGSPVGGALRGCRLHEGWLGPGLAAPALETEEIPEIVEDYRKAAERARAAGFDGVEVHAGNGYLLDQFLQDGTNRRTDAYGGSVENRARFLFDVFEAVASWWGADRVGVRVSPSTQFNAMSDSDPGTLYGHVAGRLNGYSPAYLHIIEPRIKGIEAITEGLPPVATAQLRRSFTGNILSAGGFEPESRGDREERGCRHGRVRPAFHREPRPAGTDQARPAAQHL